MDISDKSKVKRYDSKENQCGELNRDERSSRKYARRKSKSPKKQKSKNRENDSNRKDEWKRKKVEMERRELKGKRVSVRSDIEEDGNRRSHQNRKDEKEDSRSTRNDNYSRSKKKNIRKRKNESPIEKVSKWEVKRERVPPSHNDDIRRNDRVDENDRRNGRVDENDRRNDQMDGNDRIRNRNETKWERENKSKTSPEKEEFGKPKEDTSNAKEKEKSNFERSGKLAEDTNVYKGVVIKYNEPRESRKPGKLWRLYPFKADTPLKIIHLHRQSAYMIGRDRKISEIPVDHPSCSKQHAVFQFRVVPYTKKNGDPGRQIKPYILDLDSANGTFLNDEKIQPRRYVELFEKDVLKFGFSERKYVLLHAKTDTSQVDDEDDDEEDDDG